MQLFRRVTRLEMKEVQEAIELIHEALSRLRKNAKAERGRIAGVLDRLRAIEAHIQSVVYDTDVDPQGQDIDNGMDGGVEGEEKEERRLRIGRGE